jgi:hypothetical protein
MASWSRTRKWRRIGRFGLIGLFANALAGCVTSAPPFDDPGSQYARRSLTVSPTTGNAQAINTVMQTAGPWPAYSYDTNVPGDGESAVKAIKRFEGRDPSSGGAQSSPGAAAGASPGAGGMSGGAATQ